VENLNHANTQKAISSKTLVRCNKEAINSFLGKTCIIDNHPHYELTSNPADINIDLTDDSISLHSSIETSKQFIVKKENFEYLFTHLLKLHSTKEDFQFFQSKNLTNFNKLKENWSHGHYIFLKLNSFLKESRNIKEFTQCFFKLEKLQSFKTIHLFIHEKGSISSKHIQINKERFIETNQNIKEFTTLFQAIKKSKNRSFGQSSLKASNFQILGTCIGHEFSLLNHNLILLISKDDFLPQQDSDVEFFYKYKECFRSYFEILLNIEFNLDKCLFIFDSFENLPIEMETKVKSTEDIRVDSFYRELLQADFASILKKLRDTHFNLADVNHQERMVLLGELLNTLKHELSNPLFGLQLSSELLLSEDLDDEHKEFIQHIHSNIIRSQSIIDNFSGLYTDTPALEKINIESLLNEVFTLTKSESKQMIKTIQFAKNSLKELETNQTYLAQIFFNLIINSSQAMKEAGTQSPNIKIFIETIDKKMIFTITDNGPGIPADKKDYIFDTFYTTKSSGTGLGLAISKRLAEKIRGNLTLEDSPQGAKFKLEVSL